MNQHPQDIIAVITPRRFRGSVTPREYRFPDDLDAKLLAIALSELPRPLRRSERARLAYVPEPLVVSIAPKRSLLKGALRLVLPIGILVAVAALGLLGINTCNTWFAAHFHYGVQKTAPYLYHGSIVGAVALPEPLSERLPDGRTILVCYRGHLPSKSQLPSAGNSKLGDMWYTIDDGNCWVLETLTPTSSALGWIDP